MINVAGRTVMVAGGAGFVGSAVVRELLVRGAVVVSYDNYLHGVPANVAGLAGAAIVVRGDVLDELSLLQCLRRHQVEIIMDCVGDTFVPTAYEMPDRFFDINVRGTLNVLRAAQMCDVRRIVYVSSTEVYGDPCGPRQAETERFDPVNTYAVSKLAADRLCYTFFLEHQTPVVIARLFNAYGPRETQPYIVPEIIAQLRDGNVLHLGNTAAERDLTFVHDTARALIAVAESDAPCGTAINIGTGVSYRVDWLCQRIAEIMDVANVEIRVDPSRLRRRDIPCFRCDNSLLRQHTGWAPQVGIDEGLERTVQWFVDNGSRWSWEPYVRDSVLLR